MKALVTIFAVLALFSLLMATTSQAQEATPDPAETIQIVTDSKPISQELALLIEAMLSTTRRSEQMQVLMLLGLGVILLGGLWVLDRAGRRTSDSVQPSIVELILKASLEFGQKQAATTTTTLDDNLIRYVIARAGYEEASDGTLRRRPTVSEVAAQAYDTQADPNQINWLKGLDADDKG